MKPVRIIALGVAAVIAIGLMVVVRMALGGKPAPQAVAHAVVKPIPTARILIAKRDLKIGDRIADADLDWRVWPVADLKPEWTRQDAPVAAPGPSGVAASGTPASTPTPPAPGSISPVQRDHTTKQVAANGAELSLGGALQALQQQGGPKQPFLGGVVREAIAAGEPVTMRKVVRAGESGYLAVVLAAGKRAMSIPVNVDNGAGGFILPGDRVDVLLTRKLDTGKAPLILSQTVLRNMKVLAIDQTTQTEKDAAAVVGATATLEVTGDEAEALASAKMAGTLQLTLRSYADAGAGRGRNGAPPISRFGGGGDTVASLGGGGPGGGVGGAVGAVRVYRYGEAKEEPEVRQ